MTCPRFKKDMVVNIYGELNGKRRRRLEGHLARCASCREEFETTRKVLASLEKAPAESPPEIDWERNWNTIEAGLEPAGRRSGFLSALPRWWVYAPLALAVLFILGLAVGRYWWPWRPTTLVTAKLRTISPATEQALLSRYFEDVKPILLDYAHDGTKPGSEGLLPTDRVMVRSLLVQNVLLKRALARKNPTLADLLDDLGMILTEIANLQAQDTTTPESLKNVINERRVLSRMRRLEKI
ncbi:MAG TPA: zf-HC2 domain-containing protein [Acidobacteriota bacterium]